MGFLEKLKEIGGKVIPDPLEGAARRVYNSPLRDFLSWAFRIESGEEIQRRRARGAATTRKWLPGEVDIEGLLKQKLYTPDIQHSPTRPAQYRKKLLKWVAMQESLRRTGQNYDWLWDAWLTQNPDTARRAANLALKEYPEIRMAAGVRGIATSMASMALATAARARKSTTPQGAKALDDIIIEAARIRKKLQGQRPSGAEETLENIPRIV